MAGAAVTESGQAALSLCCGRQWAFSSFSSALKQKSRISGTGCLASLVLEVPSESPSACNATWAPTPWSALDDKILFFERIGVDSGGVFSKYPSIVIAPIGRLRAAMEFLKQCGLNGRDLSRLANRYPQLLDCSVEGRLRPNLDFLQKEVGIQQQELRGVISKCPRILCSSLDGQLRPTLRYLEALGLTDLATLVTANPALLTSGVDTKLHPKFEYLKSLGVSHQTALQMVWRFPTIFNYSIERNLKPKYEYLMHEMGRSLEELMTFPQFFGYSLEQRIRPRHEFLAGRNLRISLSNMLKLGDEAFYLRYGKSFSPSSTKGSVAPALDSSSH